MSSILKTVTIFRAYDVRGIYGKELTEEIATRIGAAYGTYHSGGCISLGRDTRNSGPSVERAFLKGVLSTGCNVESFGILPLPVLSYVTFREKLSGAGYISASHNPPEYNGIRFRTSEGYGLLYHQTDIIKNYQDGTFRTGNGKVREHRPEEARDTYGDYVVDKLEIRPSLKIVLDMGNGSACKIDSLYRRLGFDPIVVNGERDGNFSGRGAAPTADSLSQARGLVVEKGADFGLGFDPDADRGLVIDDLGRIVPPEKIAIILAKHRYSPGDLVIAGFDCSMIVERELLEAGIKVERERVGDVYVANRVKNSGAVLGVERSAHFFLPEFQYSDDPFAMSFALGEVISGGVKLSDLAGQIPDYPYQQRSIRCEIDVGEVMTRLEEKLSDLDPDTTDGLKITTETYSVLIRPSNTEPLVRLYVESIGDDIEDLLDRHERLIKDAMKR